MLSFVVTGQVQQNHAATDIVKIIQGIIGTNTIHKHSHILSLERVSIRSIGAASSCCLIRHPMPHLAHDRTHADKSSLQRPTAQLNQWQTDRTCLPVKVAAPEGSDRALEPVHHRKYHIALKQPINNLLKDNTIAMKSDSSTRSRNTLILASATMPMCQSTTSMSGTRQFKGPSRSSFIHTVP